MSGASGLPVWQHSAFIPLAGGEVLPVSRRAANEDVENVDFAPGRIQVRAILTPIQTCTYTQKKSTQAVCTVRKHLKRPLLQFSTILSQQECSHTHAGYTEVCVCGGGYFAGFQAQFRSFATTQTYICFKMCKLDSFWSHVWYVYVWCTMIQREKSGLLHPHLFFCQQKNIKSTFNSEQFNRI